VSENCAGTAVFDVLGRDATRNNLVQAAIGDASPARTPATSRPTSSWRTSPPDPRPATRYSTPATPRQPRLPPRVASDVACTRRPPIPDPRTLVFHVPPEPE